MVCVYFSTAFFFLLCYIFLYIQVFEQKLSNFQPFLIMTLCSSIMVKLNCTCKY